MVAVPTKYCSMLVGRKSLCSCFPHATWSNPGSHRCSGCCCLPWVSPGLRHHPVTHPRCSLGTAPAEHKSPAAPLPTQPLWASQVALGTCVLGPCPGCPVKPLSQWGQPHGCPPSLPAVGGVGPSPPPRAPCLSPHSLSSLGVLSPRHLGCLPFRKRGGGKEWANFFHVYNRAEECFCFMAAVIACRGKSFLTGLL